MESVPLQAFGLVPLRSKLFWKFQIWEQRGRQPVLLLAVRFSSTGERQRREQLLAASAVV